MVFESHRNRSKNVHSLLSLFMNGDIVTFHIKTDGLKPIAIGYLKSHLISDI